VRRAAEECKDKEIRRSKLYEALNFLEKNIDAPGLVRKYRRALQGDRPDEWQKEELRQILIAAVPGIQRSAAAASLVKRMNELAVRFRENKVEIDNLRKQRKGRFSNGATNLLSVGLYMAQYARLT
jgi:hypothetical protein